MPFSAEEPGLNQGGRGLSGSGASLHPAQGDSPPCLPGLKGPQDVGKAPGTPGRGGHLSPGHRSFGSTRVPSGSGLMLWCPGKSPKVPGPQPQSRLHTSLLCPDLAPHP